MTLLISTQGILQNIKDIYQQTSKPSNVSNIIDSQTGQTET